MSTVLKVADVVTKFLRGSLYQLKAQGCLLRFFEVVICSPEIKVLLAEEKKNDGRKLFETPVHGHLRLHIQKTKKEGQMFPKLKQQCINDVLCKCLSQFTHCIYLKKALLLGFSICLKITKVSLCQDCSILVSSPVCVTVTTWIYITDLCLWCSVWV